MTIHEDNPFVDPADDRDPARRFRGRLAAPVTIVTSGASDAAVGLTVSSLFFVEGEPPRVHLVVGPTSDLWHALQESGRFVVHICGDSQQGLADVFAGLRPSPGGMFSGSRSHLGDWGRVLEDLPNRAHCSVAEMYEAGYSGVVIGTVDEIEIGDLDNPLVHFRGRYRGLKS